MLHNKFNIFLPLVLIVCVFSCKPNSSTKKILSNKVSMQLLSFDESNQKFDKEQFISASLLLFDDKNMLYNRFYHQSFKANNELLQLIFSSLNAGDSAVFFIDATSFNNRFFELTLPKISSQKLTLYVKVNKYLNEEMNSLFKANLDNDLVEQQYINFYLKNATNTFKNKNGIYVATLIDGSGEKVKKNDIIQLKYKGYFLNHIVFDETPTNGFLEFEYGTPHQVIKGINIAIKKMKVGEKSKIIIPSHLAFGKNGSSTKIIPPATPVIYEIEILTKTKIN